MKPTVETTESLQKYVREKMEVFKDFKIALSREERNHIKSLKSEIAIDNYSTSLILRSLAVYD